MKTLLKKPLFIGFICFIIIVLSVIIKTFYFPNFDIYKLDKIFSIIIFISIILLFIKKLKFIGKGILLGILLTAIFGIISTIIFSGIDGYSKASIESEKKKYNNKEIGWTINIPSNWDIISEEENKKNNEEGLKYIEKSYEGEIDSSGIKNLISFKKNKFNKFISTIELFQNTYEGEWEENNMLVKKMLEDVYVSQGVKSKSSKITTILINGLKFKHYTITIYNKNNKKVLETLIYSRLINGYDFGISIISNNDKYKKEMIDALMTSKFKN